MKRVFVTVKLNQADPFYRADADAFFVREPVQAVWAWLAKAPKEFFAVYAGFELQTEVPGEEDSVQNWTVYPHAKEEYTDFKTASETFHIVPSESLFSILESGEKSEEKP